MTNERVTEALALLDAADNLAQALIAAEDINFSVALPALQMLMPAIAFVHMCGLIEVCPIHCCDVQICLDDNQPCQAGKPRVEANPF